METKKIWIILLILLIPLVQAKVAHVKINYDLVGGGGAGGDYNYNQTIEAINNLTSSWNYTWYNHTEIANVSIWTTYGSDFMSTYNETYAKYAYNMTSQVTTDWLYRNQTTITFNETKLQTTFYNATQSVAVTGTITGTMDYTQHKDGNYDGITLNITEAAGSPGLDVRMNFTGVTDFNGGFMRYYTSSLAGAYPLIQLWDYIDLEWEDYPPVGETTAYAIIEQPVFDSANHLQDGVVQMRLYKASNGNTNNKYYIDWVAVYKGFGTPSAEEIDPFSVHRDGSTQLTDNWNAGDYNLTLGTSGWFNGLFNISTDANFTFNGSYLTISSDISKWFYNWTDITNASLIFNYNMTSVYSYNHTEIANATMYGAYGSYWYNMTISANGDYDYNHTTISNAYTDSASANLQTNITNYNTSSYNWASATFMKIATFIGNIAYTNQSNTFSEQVNFTKGLASQGNIEIWVP